MFETIAGEAILLLELLRVKIWILFNSPASIFYWPTLAGALIISAPLVVRSWKKAGRDSGGRWRWLRGFCSYIVNPSFRADVVFTLFGVFFFFSLFGWAIISSELYGDAVKSMLEMLFGVFPGIDISLNSQLAVATVVSFLAYELGYWFDHFCKHRVPVLWFFHRVHHSAEVLSPLTIFRMHPVDMILFANIISLFVGSASGVLGYYKIGGEIGFDGKNLFLFLFAFLTIHLQHSHFWLPATGLLGRFILSPAHHQLHHSVDPAHHNKNYGSCLAVWDWIFGTLAMPTKAAQKISFGLNPRSRAPHTFKGEVLEPFEMCWKAAKRKLDDG